MVTTTPHLFTLGDKVKTLDGRYEGTIIAGVLTAEGAQFAVARNLLNPMDRQVLNSTELELVEAATEQRMGV